MIEYIQEKLTTEELLAQLAEEAAELGHAALKLRRVYDGSNPTPTTYKDALANLHEEIADVQLLLKVLELNGPNHKAKHTHIMQEKVARWARRLKKLPESRTPKHDPARVAALEAELARAMFYISAQKDCSTCKRQSKAAEMCPGYCGDCRLGKTCACFDCNGSHSKWEWVGAHGNE